MIANQKWDSPELFPLAATAMRSSDYWTRIYGIRILGNIGEASSEAAPEIMALFEKAIKQSEREISDLATACAGAIFKIEGDPAYVDRLLLHIQQLETGQKANAPYFDYKCQDVLQEIIGPGSKYTEFVVGRLNKYDPLVVDEIDDRFDLVDNWMRLALRTESPQARDCVVRFSISKDSLLSRLAKERLRDEQ